MSQIEYVNPNPHSVHLMGPDRKYIVVGSRQKVILSDWFNKYAPNHIRPVRGINEGQQRIQPVVRQRPRQVPVPVPQRNNAGNPSIKVDYTTNVVKVLQQRHQQRQQRRPTPPVPAQMRRPHPKHVSKTIVGKTTLRNEPATQYFKSILPSYRVCLSNDIGVGILSYNRLASLQRLLASIAAKTDIQRTTIFVSDESSQPEVKDWLRTVDWVVLLDNGERLGVAGNTNRLLQCLERFKYKILLNDDVEILNSGWDDFYVKAMVTTGIHHFCFRQLGVCGATPAGVSEEQKASRKIKTIQEKPQGAVMAFDATAFSTVGFMDESMGQYGMEHVDWSNRVSLSGIQKPGFHDIDGSEGFFRIHHEGSAVAGRGPSLSKAKQFFEGVRHNKSRIFVGRSEKTNVPTVSCVIPCRGTERQHAVDIIVACVKGQNYPAIEILVIEEDDAEKISLKQLVKKVFAQCPKGRQFCKAHAFNTGVAHAKHNVVLQDADIIYHRGYFRRILAHLGPHDGCHIGKEVIYMDTNSTREIENSYKVHDRLSSNKVVGYFEGGSLACTRKAFFACGGFLEDFVGYGVEDCEFFDRLKRYGKFYDERTESFIHLDHGRTDGWNSCHDKNKKLLFDLRARYGTPVALMNHALSKLRPNYQHVLSSFGL